MREIFGHKLIRQTMRDFIKLTNTQKFGPIGQAVIPIK